MKQIQKYTVILLSLLLFETLAEAQNKGGQKADIAINVWQIAVQGDSLAIDLMIEAKDFHINTRQSMHLDIVIEDSLRRAFLPYVLYTGRQGMLFDQRSEIFSADRNSPKPYYIFKGINPKENYQLRYTFKVPYASWMDKASVYVKQTFSDCCDQWLVKNEVLTVGLSPQGLLRQMLPEPVAVLAPDPAVYKQMIFFVTPEHEEVKNRVAFVSARLSYPAKVYRVLPGFKNNPQELLKVDSLIQKITGNELISIEGLRITGYASPEGAYKSNELLAKRRSMGFKDYIVKKYSLTNVSIHNDWVAEDWKGLVKLINNREMVYKEEALGIINTTGIYDSREKKLMLIGGGHPYREMLAELFPLLRRIEMRADYVVKKVTDSRAAELIYSRPELLSLEEIYKVGERYTTGTPDYQQVYEIAAKTYPNDALAINNAAAACLMSGDTQGAMTFLNKLGDNRMGYINRATYHYMTGEMQQAERFLRMALESEDTRKQAEKNLQLIAR